MFDHDAILQTFLAQTEENLAALEEALVRLESHPGDDELIRTVFRVVHTVKGDAGSLGFTGIRDVAHALEDVLEPVRRHAQPLSAERATLLLGGTDVLRAMATMAVSGQGDACKAAVELLARLRRFTADPRPPAGRSDAEFGRF